MLESLRGALPKPTREAFAAKALKEVQALGHTDARYEPDRFRIVTGEGEDATNLELGNAYANVCGVWPWQRTAELRRFLGILARFEEELPRDWSEAMPRVFPMVRHRFYLECLRPEHHVEGEPTPGMMPSRLLAQDLVLLLGFDYENQVRVISSSDLETWGKSFDEVEVAARENLEKATTEPLPVVDDGVLLSEWSDSYDASRVLVTSLFRELPFEGEPVIFLPIKDCLIVADSQNLEALAKAFAAAEKFFLEAPHPISPIPYVRHWPMLEPVEFRPEHPCYHLWRKACLTDMLQTHQDQKDQLDRKFEKDETNLFVASLSATQDKETGEYQTYAMWSRTVETLLPRAESIVFFDPDKDPDERVVLRSPWELVEKHCGSLMRKADDYYPIRYLVDDFPSEEQLAAMVAELS